MKKTLLLLTAILLTCCGSNGKKETTPDVPEATITLSAQNLSFSEEGEEKNVTVTVSTSFSVTCDQPWLVVSAGSVFKGESVLRLTARENLTGAARSATVTFACNTPGSDKKATIQVSQAALTPSITLSPTSLSFGEAGGEQEVEMTANTTWNIASDGAYWLSINRVSAVKGTSKLTVKVIRNFSDQPRTGTVTFSFEDKTVTLTIHQEAGTPIEDGAYVPEGYHLVWQDDFKEGSMPSEADWWYETGAGGWGNNELQEYVAGSKNGIKLASVSGGTLKITAQKLDGRVYSIRMNTRNHWKYGYFEGRIKVTDAPGAWPAFWMMPQNFKEWPKDGEIDIMEYAISTQGKDKSSSSIHCGAYNWPAGTQKTHVQPVPGAAAEFHIYALEWTPTEMKFYIDGEQHLLFENKNQGYNYWPFDQDFYLKLNLAWGGNMGGTVDEGKLPAIYEIDYVRVYQK